MQGAIRSQLHHSGDKYLSPVHTAKSHRQTSTNTVTVYTFILPAQDSDSYYSHTMYAICILVICLINALIRCGIVEDGLKIICPYIECNASLAASINAFKITSLSGACSSYGWSLWVVYRCFRQIEGDEQQGLMSRRCAVFIKHVSLKTTLETGGLETVCTGLKRQTAPAH